MLFIGAQKLLLPRSKHSQKEFIHVILKLYISNKINIIFQLLNAEDRAHVANNTGILPWCFMHNL